jgi:hypothetical protein
MHNLEKIQKSALSIPVIRNTSKASCDITQERDSAFSSQALLAQERLDDAADVRRLFVRELLADLSLRAK